MNSKPRNRSDFYTAYYKRESVSEQYVQIQPNTAKDEGSLILSALFTYHTNADRGDWTLDDQQEISSATKHPPFTSLFIRHYLPNHATIIRIWHGIFKHISISCGLASGRFFPGIWTLQSIYAVHLPTFVGTPPSIRSGWNQWRDTDGHRASDWRTKLSPGWDWSRLASLPPACLCCPWLCVACR